MTPDDAAWFWPKVNKTETCWLWTGSIGPNGYAQSKNGRVHRWSYRKLVGPIPDGLQLDHLCRVRHCVNPSHLEPVTPLENTRRGLAGHPQKAKTHCPQGHPYSGANLFVNRAGSRMCRTCMRNQAAERWRRVNGKTQRRFDGHMVECPNGHPYTGDNVDLDPQGYRRCMTCRREQWKRTSAKSRR